MLAVFTWRVFRPVERWGVVAFGCSSRAWSRGYWERRAGGSLTVGAARAIPALRLGRRRVRIAAYAWAVAEATREYIAARRRCAIGLTDPIVANRMLLWSIGLGAVLAIWIHEAITMATGPTPTPLARRRRVSASSAPVRSRWRSSRRPSIAAASCSAGGPEHGRTSRRVRPRLRRLEQPHFTRSPPVPRHGATRAEGCRARSGARPAARDDRGAAARPSGRSDGARRRRRRGALRTDRARAHEPRVGRPQPTPPTRSSSVSAASPRTRTVSRGPLDCALASEERRDRELSRQPVRTDPPARPASYASATSESAATIRSASSR